MLKAPRRGAVKTRLAREIGDEAALAAYRRLAERQIVAVPRSMNLEIHYTPTDARAEMAAWLGTDRSWHPQGEGDLGERLAAAFAGAFRRGARRALAIGGDCAELDGERLRLAAEALDTAEVVLGPALDGGYYLIGLRQPCPELFQGIAWSTPAVFEQTCARARAAGLSLGVLEALEDVDDLASWRRVEGLLQAEARA
jgi:rSAM/selenodomain-associated transferase 1